MSLSPPLKSAAHFGRILWLVPALLAPACVPQDEAEAGAAPVPRDAGDDTEVDAQPDAASNPVDAAVGATDGAPLAPDGAAGSDGAVVSPDGSVVSPDGSVVPPDGSVVPPDGSVVPPDGSVVPPDGSVVPPDAAPLDAAPEVDAAWPPGCVPPGGAVPSIPNPPECGPGLAAIGCARPDANGACGRPCVGASICARCGDGVCGEGENLCNCAADCAPGCDTTMDCVDHPAPIRCLGQWRCDPEARWPGDHRGADGCSYTCLGALPACDADQACPAGDRCAPCPAIPDLCAGPTVCVPGDDLSCERATDCEGLPHVACDGAWACDLGACAYRCD